MSQIKQEALPSLWGPNGLFDYKTYYQNCVFQKKKNLYQVMQIMPIKKSSLPLSFQWVPLKCDTSTFEDIFL